MDSQTALYWMIGFTSTAAACLIIQVILLAFMARASWAAKKQAAELVARVGPLVDKIEPIADQTQQVLEDVRRYAAEISSKTNDLLDLSRTQLIRVDDVLGEAAARTRAQMDRIEMVMDDTVNRFQETTTLLQNSIVRPVRQINAVTAGIRAALSYLAGSRRATVEQATHDEEMFI
jgi:ABC-type transporter Mla subunit MlaD